MEQKKSKHSRKYEVSFFRLILFIVCIAIMLISGFHIVKWFRENKKSKANIEKIQEIVATNEDATTFSFDKLKQQNSDTVAWLKVEGTNIEYPVVKASDNLYYLEHSFDKSENGAGWIFADYNNKFDGTDKNIVIFGHNRRDGSMFGSLKNVLEKEWCENEKNKYITLITEKGEIKYEVFSVYKVENEDYYIKNRFKNNDEFAELVKTVKERSIYNFENTVEKSDKILTLSTCADNNRYRVVLHAKKI